MHLIIFFITFIIKWTKTENLNEEVYEKLTISSLNKQDVLSSFNFTIHSTSLNGIFYFIF